MANSGTAVMQFDKDMSSRHREFFETARALLLSYEGIIETKKPRITTYSDKHSGICHMRTMPHGIDLGFLKGVHLDDRFEVLKGTSKVMRVLSLDKMDRSLISYYLDQAIQLNASCKRNLS